MRILLFSSTYAPRTGGVETVTRHLVRGLVERGHEVTVATNRYPRGLPAHEEIDSVPVWRQLYPNIPFVSLKEERTPRQLVLGLLHLPVVPVALARLFVMTRRARPDLVNVHYFSYPAVYMVFVAWVLRIPTILSFHGSDLSEVPYPAIRRWVLQLVCRVGVASTACSADLASYLGPFIAVARRHIPVVAHNGVDDMEWGPAGLPGPEKGRVLVVARLVEKKGVGVAINAFSRLQQTGMEAKLVIAGGGPERERLQNLARELGVEGAITFLGDVPPETVGQEMARASLVLVPSLWEGFGVVCLEGMICGRPVIASRTGGIPEIVVDGETGLLVPPNDPPELARAISELLAHPTRMSEMGRRGRERALVEFSWERTVDQYLDAYAIGLEVKERRSLVPVG